MIQKFHSRIKIRVTQAGYGKIWIDDKELPEVRSVSVKSKAGEVAIVTIELQALDGIDFLVDGSSNHAYFKAEPPVTNDSATPSSPIERYDDTMRCSNCQAQMGDCLKPSFCSGPKEG